MYYGELKKYDIANGPGVRVSLFVSGCSLHCKGCFQPETWDAYYGSEFTNNTMKEILDALEPKYIEGFTLLGGDPLEPVNQECVSRIVLLIKSLYPGKTIWLYTGRKLEDLLNTDSKNWTIFTRTILNNIDVLVDGPFIERLKDISLAYAGSSNQRIINIPVSLRENKTILL